MAKNKDYKVPSDKEFDYKADYQGDWDTHSKYITEFDSYEAMLISQVYDSVSKSVDGGKITDGYATTLAKERADRVMAKLPEGSTESAGKVDVGKAMFMDILRQKWIYPNANAQHPLLEKLNMWEFYKSVYGYMPMFYDWNVAPSGYAGPDCWLWNPRNLVPQQGRTSIQDMDYVTALTWVSKKQLEKWRDSDDDNGGWDKEALGLLIELAENEKGHADQQQDTQVARTRTPGSIRKGICLATRYEAGEDGNWCTFAPEHGFVQVREIPNPHKNGRIPFVINYSQPLFDSFYGLGDFQRAKPLQFARDGLTNFYMVGAKNQLVPPIVANANGVLKHTLDYRAGGVILETLPNSVRTLDVGTTSLNTYQGVQSALTGQLLSQYGSQNAAAPGAESLNPSQGKTPAAIDLYSDKEATRDGASRRHLEAAIEQLQDGWASLIVNIGTEDIPVELFSKDIEEIQKSGGADVMEMFQKIQPDATGTAGTLRIKPESLKGVEYRFNIDAASTTKMNKEKALGGLERLMGAIGKFQNVFQDDPTIKVNWGAMMDAYEELSDIKGASDFITVDPNAQPPPPPPEPPKAPPSPHEIFNIKDMASIAPQAAAVMLEMAGLPGDELRQAAPGSADEHLKAQQQDHQQEMDKAKLFMEAHQQGHQQQNDALQADQQAQQTQFDQTHQAAQFAQGADQADKSHQVATKQAETQAKTATMKGKNK